MTALPPFSSNAMVYVTTIELEDELDSDELDSDEIDEALDDALVSEEVDSDDSEVNPERSRLLKPLQLDMMRADSMLIRTKESLFFILIPSFREPLQ